MRLTQKADKEHEHLKMCIGWYELPTRDYQVRVINETPNQMYQKLGQLEDIEEELGIDLITLFKALTDGFYYKDGFGDIEHLDKETLHLLVGKKFQELKEQTKDYGKTWALTKEELEK